MVILVKRSFIGWIPNISEIKIKEILQPIFSLEMISLSFLNGPTSASFLFVFGLFKQTKQFLQQINLSKMSHLPQPLDQGSRPKMLSLLNRNLIN